jgi:MraZ protein
MAQSGTAIFAGEYTHTLDDKGRLTIPSEWRYGHAENDTFLAVPVSGYIAVLPPAEVEKIRGQIATMKLKDAAAQASAAKFFSETQAFSFDKAGRVIISADLLDRAGIKRGGEAVLVGSLVKFSIYSPARWKQEKALAEASNGGDMLSRLDI